MVSQPIESTQPNSSNTLPTVEQYTTPERYAARYISRVTSEPSIEAPDTAQATGEYVEVLQSLYTQHQAHGPSAAMKAWQALAKFMPGLAALVRHPENHLLHANELHTLPTPEYQLDEYPLYKAGLNVIVGESGSGKSFLALDIAAKTAVHEDVIYIVGEGLFGYAARWEAWAAHHDEHGAKLWFYPKELDVSEPNALAMFIDMIQSRGIKPKLVVVDTVARCMGELDENSTRDMGLFIKRTSYIREQFYGCGVLLVHHTGKNGLMRGSSALYGAADGILFVSKTEEVISIYNDRDRGGKNKDAKPWEPMYRQMVPKTVVRGDKQFESVVLIPTEKIEYDLSDDDLLTEKQRAVMSSIKHLGGSATVSEIKDDTGLPKSTVYFNIKQLLVKEFLSKDGVAYELTEAGSKAL
ncbi:MAG: AAA family ATPase [Chloroflexota bacterium]